MQKSAPPAPAARLITGNERHLGPVKNCAGCGLILTLADFSSLPRCPHCTRPLAMHDTKRRTEEGEDIEGLKKAVALKNRLLQYDKQAQEMTHVIDDSGAQPLEDVRDAWQTDGERIMALEQQRIAKAAAVAESRVFRVDLNLASGTLSSAAAAPPTTAQPSPHLNPNLSGSSLAMFEKLLRG
jgi:hypothetical protein